MKALSLLVFLTVQITTTVLAQSSPDPHFDTVSIRPSNPNDATFGYNPNPNNFQGRGVGVRFLIELAYGANENDITGIPSTLSNLKFEIRAKSDIDPASPSSKLRYSSDEGRRLFEARMKSMLADRFQLKLHPATAYRSVLSLEAARKPHLSPAVTENAMQTFGPGHLKFDSIDMDGFASALTGRLLTNVINHTNLPGNYSVELTWNVRDQTEPLTYPFSAVSDALTDQLGLKLVPERAIVQILVIDKAALPSPN